MPDGTSNLASVAHPPSGGKNVAPQLSPVHQVVHTAHDPHLALSALLVIACVVMLYVIHRYDRRHRSPSSAS
jgi:hypothetical protein